MSFHEVKMNLGFGFLLMLIRQFLFFILSKASRAKMMGEILILFFDLLMTKRRESVDFAVLICLTGKFEVNSLSLKVFQ